MSEAAAENLYGPAPEGDEDPTANQYPSDPGGTSEREIGFPAELLSGQHLGHKIHVEDEGFVDEGVLAGVRHAASMISEGTIAGRGQIVLGRRTTVLRFTHGFINVRPEARVELLD